MNDRQMLLVGKTTSTRGANGVEALRFGANQQGNCLCLLVSL